MRHALAVWKAVACALMATACGPSGGSAPREPIAHSQAPRPALGPFADEDPELRAPLPFLAAGGGLANVDTALVVTDPPEAAAPSACNEQAPQDFLIRSNFTYREGAPPDEVARRLKLHNEAIEYRTRRYGYVAGFGFRGWNRLDPTNYGEHTSFFGLKVVMNKRVVPALHCVEAEIRRSCGEDAYKPHILAGLRFKNTYPNGEVSNHTYGIAIDIDPDINSCCGCVPPLDSWPVCKRPASSPFERSRIPKCWVDSFAKYGFYWLGLDRLADTMHFEFLGDPDKIVKSPKPSQ